MKIIALLTVIIFLIATIGMVQADVFMKQKQHTDAYQIMGQKEQAKDLIQSVWITEGNMRSDNDELSIIMLTDEGIIYFINHSKKTIAKMSSNFIAERTKEAMQDEDMTAGEKEGFEKFAQNMMKIKITVVETDEKKKINDWNCRKYIQTQEIMGMVMTAEIWATEDLDVDQDLYTNMNASAMMMMPGMKESIAQIVSEMKKIKGVQVLSIKTSDIMGTTMKSTTELLEFKDVAAPDGTFDLPPGYIMEDAVN